MPYLAALAWAIHAHAADPSITQAESIANSFMSGRFDTRAGVTNNAISPMQGKTQMVAQDGTAFDSAIQCASAAPMLKVFAQPASTGDLQTLVLTADLNLDGTPDTTVSPAGSVSGVCANGFISCDPGTWNGCSSWLWEINGGAITAREVPITDLEGCYCINNSCGSSLVWTNLDTVLRDIGSAVTRKIQEIRPNLVVTDTKTDGTFIEVYAADSAGCRAGNSANQAYIADNNLLQSDLQAEVNAQSADPSSLYNLVTGSIATSTSMTTVNTCSITRTVNLDEVQLNDIIKATGGSAQVLACGSDCLDLVLGKVGDNYWAGNCTIYTEYADFWLYKPSRIKQAIIRRAKWDDYIRIELGNDTTGYTLLWDGPYTGSGQFPPETSGACELAKSWDKNPNKDITDYFTSRDPGPVRFRIRVSVTGNGEGYAYARINVDTSCSILPNDTIVDNCTALEANPDCVLEEEIVDGVTTYRNYNPTLLQPLPSTRTIQGQSCALPATRDWWQKTRTYRCNSATTFNFDDALHRADVAQQTADLSNGFTETHRDENGNWVNTQVSLGSPAELPVVNDCENVCKIKKEVPDDRVATDYVTASNRTAPGTKTVYRYAVCDAQNACPVQPGETIVKDCQCLNEFAEAATIMQLMRQAGQDLICGP